MALAGALGVKIPGGEDGGFDWERRDEELLPPVG